jgi:hypothetical protein
MPRLNAMVLSFASLFAIGFGVWLVSAGKRYREEYASATEGWRVGTVHQVELTVVRTDKQNLSCACDAVVSGLRCGFRRDFAAAGLSADDPHLRQPYNTTNNELLLGAGLWTSPPLTGPLPANRFTVVCNYHIEGTTRSAGIRFAAAAPFAPVDRAVTIGSLTDCALPQ